MQKRVKYVLAMSACIVLTGCPKVKTVTGNAIADVKKFGLGSRNLEPGDNLIGFISYTVDSGASVTVEYDNGKSCTFTSNFVPGDDGSVCGNQDNKEQQDDKKADDDDDNDPNKDDQGQEQGDASNGNSGISAPNVTPTPVPQYSGIGGPQVIATGVPTYDPSTFMSIVTNPIVTNTLAVIGGLAVAKEVHDQTDGNGDKPVSK